MPRMTPVRKVSEGATGTYYEAKTACGKLKIIIVDGEDGYPCRLTTQVVGGNCEGNAEAVQRLITLLLEMNARAECVIDELNKIVCPACRSKFLKGEKDIAFSCGKAVARALEKHITQENGEKKK